MSNASAIVETNSQVSPYTLYPSDNPGSLITPVLLRDDNYSEWATELYNSLQAKQKVGFINGSILKPATEPDLSRWTAANSMIIGWIRTSIDPKIRSTVTHVGDASKLWEALRVRFSVKSGVRRHLLQDNVTNCKQNGQSVLEYYGRLSKLWEEIQNLQTCPSCTCAAASAIEKEKEDARVHKFLFGLDDSRFGSLRSQIINEEPFPDLNSVYSRVVRQEQYLLSLRSEETSPDVIGFSVQRETLQNTPIAAAVTRPRDSSRFCTHCNRRNHDVSECFLLHGYPEWYLEQQSQSSSRGSGSQRGRGSRSNSGSRGRGRANVSRVVTNVPSSSPSLPTTDQVDALLTLLQNQRPQQATDRVSGKAQLTDLILDTGASHHMTGDITLLRDLRPVNRSDVTFPDGRVSRATHVGKIDLTGSHTLRDMLYIPSFNTTLISVNKLVKQTGCIAIFTDTLCVLQDRFTKTLIGAGEEREGVYYFTGMTTARCNSVTDVKLSPTTLWHRRLGHLSTRILASLPFFNNVDVDSDHVKRCDICYRAKQTRDVFHESSNKAFVPFALIHCDVWGPYRTVSSCGAVYFLTIVDDFSRAVWVFLMKEKSEVSTLLQNFCAMAQRQFQHNVQCVRSDNGTEFIALSHYFRANGILHQTTCVDTPQQNGRVERKHRHILNIARACLFQANLPTRFWGESILTAAYLINRTPTPLLHGKTPYEMLHNTPPSYDTLRIFGCLCYAHSRSRTKDKFGPRSRKCIFVGYPFGKKAWKLYDIEKDQFFYSRDVVFLEDEFPGLPLPSHSRHSSQVSHDFIHDDWQPSLFEHEASPVTAVVPAPCSPDSPVMSVSKPVSVVLPSDLSSSGATDDAFASIIPSTTASESVTSPVPLGRGHRQRHPSVLLKDYVTNSVQQKTIPSLTSSPSDLGPQTTVPGNTLYPISDYISDTHYSPGHQAFLAAVTSAYEPRSYKDAMTDDVWNDSMTDEHSSLLLNKTWIETDLPPGKKAIGCKWVYKLKYHSDGSLARHKSRLVALGNKQTEGVDYSDTFAPVVKQSTIRILLDVAASKQWEVHQMDVHNAFLHGDLEEEVYMKFPPGFESKDPNKVCLLKKAIYGLKQAPRCWFSKLSTTLRAYGFTQSKADTSHFSYLKGDVILHILIYVDDFIIACNDLSTMTRFKAYLSKCFHMKDLGKLKYFLGIEVARSSEGFFLSQRKYALDIVSETGLLAAKPASTPIEINHKLSLAKGSPLVDPQPYRRLVGRLIYLSFTRPELSYAIHVLSQFMTKPLEAHWQACLRVVRYIKGTPAHGILLRADSNLRLTAFCDADWAACPLTRRSLSAYIVLLGNSPISWKTKKQDTVSMSSAEAEYRSMAYAVRELKWLKELLLTFGVTHEHPMQLYCDSKSALHIAANPVFHERTKHIERDCHFVRDAIIDKLITTAHLTTKEQPADLLTKALPTPSFTYLLSKLGIQDISPPT